MGEENGKDFVGINVFASAVQGAEAVRVAIRGEAGVVAACDHRFTQRGYVRLDRFRVKARKKWVVLAMNLPVRNPRLGEQSGQAPARRAEHGIHYEAPPRSTHAVQANRRFQPVEMRTAKVRHLDRRAT